MTTTNAQQRSTTIHGLSLSLSHNGGIILLRVLYDIVLHRIFANNDARRADETFVIRRAARGTAVVGTCLINYAYKDVYMYYIYMLFWPIWYVMLASYYHLRNISATCVVDVIGPKHAST